MVGDVGLHLVLGEVRSGWAPTSAFGSSPASTSGTPITATSATFGWAISGALELGRRHLDALVLDEFFDTVDLRRVRRLIGPDPAVKQAVLQPASP